MSISRMNTLVRLGLLLSLTIGPAQACGQSKPVSDIPGPEFTEILAGLRDPVSKARRANALEQLKREREWEPYLRAVLNASSERKDRELLRQGLIVCQDPLFAWNLERAKDWAKELRFDYLTDLAAATDDGDRAAAIAVHVIAMQKVVYDKYQKLPRNFNMPEFLPMRSFLNSSAYKAWSGHEGFGRFSGDYVEIPKERESGCSLIHARSGKLATIRSGVWISLTTTPLEEAPSYKGMPWRSSVVCVNRGTRLAGVSGSLIVCDGDVELWAGPPDSGGNSFHESVLVANGDVHMANWYQFGGHLIYAAGDFKAANPVHLEYRLIFAGGKIEPMPEESRAKPGSRLDLHPNAKENPLGIKFVAPADAGVELKVDKEQVRLGTLAKDSPLTAAGLEPGDLVFKQNGLRMKSAADFRRQLRESLLWGTGLFEIKRGEQSFLRLVKFAEPPKK